MAPVLSAKTKPEAAVHTLTGLHFHSPQNRMAASTHEIETKRAKRPLRLLLDTTDTTPIAKISATKIITNQRPGKPRQAK